MLQMVMTRIAVEIFFSHGTEKIFRGTLLCFTKSLLTKVFTDRGGGGEGGSIKTFCRKFLSHSAETCRRETLLCFTKSLVSKLFMDREAA